MATIVIHKRFEQPGDEFIGRPSVLGNPYLIGENGTREECIAKFRVLLISKLRSPDYCDLLDYVRSLRGRRLVCFCKPKPCHGDVIAEFADMSDEELERTLAEVD